MLNVARLRPQCRFVLVGDGPELARLRGGVAKLNGQVLTTGRVHHDALPGIVAAFDVAIAPGCGFYMSPLKIAEWMAGGRAIVAPDLGGVRDMIDDGRTGVLCDPMDVHAFVAAVLRLVDDPERRRSIGAAAAMRAREVLSWRHNASRVATICENVLRARAAHAPN
jgi:glycosyltransferase involved in cell wall biosynthesis